MSRPSVAALFNQPPVKPARFNPRNRLGTLNVFGVTIPTHGVRNGIAALRTGGAAAILEIVKTGFAHGRVIDAAIVQLSGDQPIEMAFPPLLLVCQ